MAKIKKLLNELVTGSEGEMSYRQINQLEFFLEGQQEKGNKAFIIALEEAVEKGFRSYIQDYIDSIA